MSKHIESVRSLIREYSGLKNLLTDNMQNISQSINLWWNGNRQGYTDDIDAYVPRLNEASANTWINKLKDIDERVKAGTYTWQEYYDSFTGVKEGKRYIAKWGEATQGRIRTAEELIAATEQERTRIIENNRVIDMAGAKYRIASAAKKAFAMAGNMAITWMATKLIETIANGIDNIIHATDRAKESLQEASVSLENTKSDIESVNSEIKTTQERIDELNAKENLSLVDEQELEKLKKQNNELERELRIKEKLAESEQEEVNDRADGYFNRISNSIGGKKGTLID